MKRLKLEKRIWINNDPLLQGILNDQAELTGMSDSQTIAETLFMRFLPTEFTDIGLQVINQAPARAVRFPARSKDPKIPRKKSETAKSPLFFPLTGLKLNSSPPRFLERTKGRSQEVGAR